MMVNRKILANSVLSCTRKAWSKLMHSLNGNTYRLDSANYSFDLDFLALGVEPVRVSGDGFLCGLACIRLLLWAQGIKLSIAQILKGRTLNSIDDVQFCALYRECGGLYNICLMDIEGSIIKSSRSHLLPQCNEFFFIVNAGFHWEPLTLGKQCLSPLISIQSYVIDISPTCLDPSPTVADFSLLINDLSFTHPLRDHSHTLKLLNSSIGLPEDEFMGVAYSVLTTESSLSFASLAWAQYSSAEKLKLDFVPPVLDDPVILPTLFSLKVRSNPFTNWADHPDTDIDFIELESELLPTIQAHEPVLDIIDTNTDVNLEIELSTPFENEEPTPDDVDTPFENEEPAPDDVDAPFQNEEPAPDDVEVFESDEEPIGETPSTAVSNKDPDDKIDDQLGGEESEVESKTSDSEVDVATVSLSKFDVSVATPPIDLKETESVGPGFEHLSNIEGKCLCYPICQDSNLEDEVYQPMRLIRFMHSSRPKTFTDCDYYNLNKSLFYISIIKDFSDDLDMLDKCVAFIDFTLKYRHDMCCSLFIPDFIQSDIPFYKVLPIDSRRTPDYILVDGLSVTVIEVGLVSDLDRGKSLKGLDKGGKYYKEKAALEALGFKVSLETILIDTDGSNIDDIRSKTVVSQDVFNLTMDRMITLTRILRRFFRDWMSLIFRKVEVPQGIRDYPMKNLDFLLPDEKTAKIREVSNSKVHYGFNSSTEMVRKQFVKKFDFLNNSCKRLKEEGLYRLIFDQSKNDVFFKESVAGLRPSDWVSALAGQVPPPNYIDVVNKKTGMSISMEQSFFNPHLHGVETYSGEDIRLRKTISKYKDYFDFGEHECDIYYVPENMLADRKYLTVKSLVFSNMCEVIGYEDTMLNKLYDLLEPELKSKVLDFDSFNEYVPKLPKFLMVSYPLDSKLVSEAQSAYVKALSDSNMPKNCVYKRKCCFLYPIADYVSGVQNLNEIDLSKLFKSFSLGPFTSLVLDSISNLRELKSPVNKTTEYWSHYSKYMEVQSKITNLIVTNKEDIMKLDKNEEYIILKSERMGIQKSMEKSMRDSGASRSKGIKCVRLSSQPGHKNRINWNNEMQHIKVKGSSNVQAGEFFKKKDGSPVDMDQLSEEFGNMKDWLMMSREMSTYDTLDNNAGPDPKVLFELKKMYINRWIPMYDYLKGLNLYHSSVFITRLCTSLHYFSTCSQNRDYVMFDKIGSNSLLLVKGGVKIYKKGQSRWFKLIYPIDSSMLNWSLGESSKMHQIGNQYYIETPWSRMHETLVTEGMFFAHKITGFLMNCALQSSLKYQDVFHKCCMHVLLAFHQRRKTESTLHNLRYILVNCFSLFTDYKSLLVSLPFACRDKMQMYIMWNLGENIRAYYQGVSKFTTDATSKLGKLVSQDKFDVIHPISGDRIESINDFSFSIYLTALMCKAPVDNMNEQIVDLKEVKGSFLQFQSEVPDTDSIECCYDSTACDASEHDYLPKLFSGDFKFDPKFCWLLGRFCGDYLKSFSLPGDLDNKLDGILNDPYHNIANTSGLRGRDIDGADFFGKKGYYVVFKQLPDIDMDTVSKILLSDDTDYNKTVKIKSLNITLIIEYSKVKNDEMLLHMVHKIQKGGPREIYVMNYQTKIRQQVLEKFFKALCHLMPNEMISIASNKRPTWLHQRIFENEPGLDFNNISVHHTYDCRRWAPHSNILKYFYFVSGMSFMLPPAFISIFMHFWDLYVSKILVVREKMFEGFAKNKEHIDWAQTWSKRGESQTKTMIFSFMMGIFNYLSSLMHAASQLYMRYIIKKVSNLQQSRCRSASYQSDLVLIAHSDDSGGKSYNKNLNSLIITCAIHEVILKMGNHMISKKKSCISRHFFELVSILYLGGVFLPVTTKFIGNLAISPTDNGYIDDMHTGVSKCIECLTVGCTIQQAYLVLKLMTSMVRYFYELPITLVDYQIPVEVTGICDGHPLMYLLAGTEYDDCRNIVMNENNWARAQTFLSCLNGKYWTEKISPKYTTLNKYREEFSAYEDQILKLNLSDLEKKMINFIDKSTTVGNMVQFSRLIKDDKFTWSLDYQTRSRRITRGKWFCHTPCIETFYGGTTYKKINKMFLTIFSMIETDEYVLEEHVKLLADVIKTDKVKQQINIFLGNYKKAMLGVDDITMLVKVLDRLELSMERIIEVPTTVRPSVINLDIGISPIGSDFNIDRTMLHMYAPKLIPLVKKGYLDKITSENVLRLLPQEILSDPTLTKKVLSEYKNKVTRRFYLYSQTPRGKTHLNDYRAVMSMLSYSSLFGKEIRGLQIPLSNRLTMTGTHYLMGGLATHDNLAFDIYMVLSSLFSKESAINGDYKKLSSLQILTPDGSVKTVFEVVSDLQSRATSGALSLLATGICSLMLLTLTKDYLDQGVLLNDSDYSNLFLFIFTKSQQGSGSNWWGKGEVLFFYRGTQIKVALQDNDVKSLSFDKLPTNIGELMHYIDLFLVDNHYNRLIKKMKFLKTNDEGLCFDTRTNEYYFGPPNPYSQYMPANIGVFTVSLQTLIGSRNMMLKDLFKIQAVRDDDDPLKFYFTPSKSMYSLGFSPRFLIDSPHNQEILLSLGHMDLSPLDIITTRVYKKDLMWTKSELIDNVESSQLYRIISESPVWPSEVERTVPGVRGGFCSSLMNYKENHAEYGFHPHTTYLSTMITMGQYYTGTVLNQLLLDSSKVWSTLRRAEKREVLEDVRDLANKIDNITTANKEELSKTIQKWGVANVEYAISAYNEEDQTQVLETLKYAVEFQTKQSLSTPTIELLALVGGAINYSSRQKWNQPAMTGKDRIGWMMTVFDNMLKWEVSYVSINSPCLVALRILSKFICTQPRARKFFNSELKKMTIMSISKIQVSQSSSTNLAEMIYKMINVMLLNNESGRESTENRQFVTQVMFEMEKVYKFKMIMPMRVRVERLPYTGDIEYVGPNLNAPYTKKFGPLKVFDSDDDEDILDEIKLLGADEFEEMEQFEDKLKSKQESNQSDEVLSKITYQTSASTGCELLSSISNNIMIVFKARIPAMSTKARNGGLRVGYIPREASQDMGIGSGHCIVGYTTDGDMSVHKNYGINYLNKEYCQEIPFALVNLEETAEKYNEFIKMLTGKDKEYIDDQGLEEIMDERLVRLKKLGYDISKVTSVKEYLKNRGDKKDFDEYMRFFVGSYIKRGQLEAIRKTTRDVVKEERDSLKLNKMLVRPAYLGHIRRREIPDRTMSMIKDDKLRAELNAVSEGFGDRILAGDCSISNENFTSIKRTMALCLKLSENGGHYDKMVCMYEIVSSFLHDILISERGVEIDNRAFTALGNLMMGLVVTEAPTIKRRTPVLNKKLIYGNPFS